MAILFGNLSGTGLLSIIILVVLIFWIPNTAWHGHLSRLTYLCMFLGGGLTAFGLIYYGIPEPFRDYAALPMAALLGGAIGSFFAVLFYRRRAKANGEEGMNPTG